MPKKPRSGRNPAGGGDARGLSRFRFGGLLGSGVDKAA